MMSRNDIYVVIILALVGYWGTSAIIRFFKKEHDWTRKNAGGSSQSFSSENANNESLWCGVLGVSQNASTDEIKAAYKRKISMYHPDKVSSMGPEFNEIAQRKTKEINAAYDEAMKYRNA